MKRVALNDPRYYLNRHVEWLEFNRRVLDEARDIGNPLLERVKFLAITANNLDEFVEVRVASFLQQIEHGSRDISPDGLTPEQELAKISAAMHVFVNDQYKCWNQELIPALAKESIRIIPVAQLDARAAKEVKTFYDRRVYPMLTPARSESRGTSGRMWLDEYAGRIFLARRKGRRGSRAADWGRSAVVIRDGKMIEAQISLRHKNGHRIPVQLRAFPIRNAQGAIVAVAESFEETISVSEWDRRHTKLATYGCLDQASGVLNHGMVESHLRENLGMFAVHPVPFSILCVQIDHLDKIQARDGPGAVAATIRVVGQTLENSLRPTNGFGRACWRG